MITSCEVVINYRFKLFHKVNEICQENIFYYTSEHVFISGGKASVLARANFEETKKHVVNASFYGEKDMLRGVVENVLVGHIVPIGTGMVKLGIDVSKLKEAAKE